MGKAAIGIKDGIKGMGKYMASGGITGALIRKARGKTDEENPADKAISKLFGLTKKSKEFLEKNKDKISSVSDTIFKHTPMGIAMGLGKKLGEFAGKNKEKITNAAKAVFDNSPLGLALNTSIGKKLKGKASELFNSAKDKASNVWGSVKGAASAGAQKASEMYSTAQQTVSNAVDTARENVSSGVQQAGETISNALNILKVKGPMDAINYFRGKRSAAEQEVGGLLQSGGFEDIKRLGEQIKDPLSMGQNKNIDTLSPEFKKRVQAFLDSPEARAKNVRIREAKRSPLTQLAYYVKGRSGQNYPFVHEMFKLAGFPGGAWSPGITNTNTLGSEHFTGNAIDLEDNGRGDSFYRELAPIAKKYGLEWGGDWQNFRDTPHFQMPSNDAAIGYSGKPPAPKDSNDPALVERADSYSQTRYQNARAQTSSTASTANLAQRNNLSQEYTTTATIKESPIITNDKVLLSQIYEAINIQKAINDEQVRHNSVSENFYERLIGFIQEMAEKDKKVVRGGTSSRSNNTRNAALSETAQMSRGLMMQHARAMAEG
jgi:peptidoglycan L-alanyl-D-glutamate endopeptidase CwlK